MLLGKKKGSAHTRATLGIGQLVLFLFGVAATSVAVIYVVAYGEQHGKLWLGVASLIQVVVPVLLALMVTPTQDRESNKAYAVTGVDELLRLRRSQVHLRRVIEESAEGGQADSIYAYKRIIEIIKSQTEYVESNLALWARIHPEAAEEVAERRAAMTQMLQDFETKRGDDD